ncbi:uncharacterized protein BDR25DRAFT_355069 [Lindgomyces ingoldianus]|uniref:Uncharacterized protein n=1 Tax=Lindgomyces ingoldianus TaxID=673940 RepID=A0ACB6QU95_9PLEO|nr:uncharacterized protein BDR25DRAFT_355069 [Lindgomyces ingoldianus]KAF2470579.1 hypothetical protein BDR25DRAFT_355069 [Lindgomyces ingoldianus]
MVLTLDGYIYYSVRRINSWLIIRTFLVVLAQWYRAPVDYLLIDHSLVKYVIYVLDRSEACLS